MRLIKTLKRSFRLAWVAEQRGISPAELGREMLERGLSRRDLLERSIYAGAALGAVPLIGAACGDGGGGGMDAGGSPDGGLNPDAGGMTQPVIAIVGAGLAGLNCAHKLAQANLTCKLYDAAARVGGRMRTARGMLPGGQIADLGGELIDTDNAAVIGLAQELMVPLDDLSMVPGAMNPYTYRFNSALLTDMALADGLRPLVPHVASAYAAVEASDTEFDRIDSMSMVAWLDSLADVGAPIKHFLEVAYTSEYGLDAAEQSALNLIYILDVSDPNDIGIFGSADERYSVRGGADTLCQKVADALPAGTLELETKLIAIGATSDNRTKLTLQHGGAMRDEVVDHAVLALPFSLLRAVDLSAANLPADKVSMIQELGYGTHTKLIGQFSAKPWLDADHTNGTGLSDEPAIQSFWDSSRAQAGSTGLLSIFSGGADGVMLGMGTAEASMQAALPGLERIFPGTMAAYVPSTALKMHWPAEPLALGSYACYRVGQGGFTGLEGKRVRNIHFAGEHTSVDYQGSMEGAAQSGAAAAMEILDDLGR